MTQTRSESSAVLVLGCVLLLSACTRSASTPDELVDGSPARRLQVPLEGAHGPAVLARVRVVRLGRASAPSRAVASCVRSWSARAASPAVVRTGVVGTSVTFEARSRRALFACDGVGDPAWRCCGRSYGRLRAGRLIDPRLDLAACPQSSGVVAYAWIRPGARTRFVAVRQGRFVEAYPTADGLPVRVATMRGVDVGRSAATFDVSEHARDGRLLRSYELRASVAG